MATSKRGYSKQDARRYNVNDNVIGGTRTSSNWAGVKTQPGDNTHYLEHNLTMASWRKVNMKDPVEVEDRVQQYFQLCLDNDMKPSVAGLALAFRVNRRTIVEHASGHIKQTPPECAALLENAMLIINSLMEDYMQNGKVNPVSGIFLMKNNLGYTDRTEYSIEHKDPLGEMQAAELIQQKYAELPPD